jgi:hypothetical protein
MAISLARDERLNMIRPRWSKVEESLASTGGILSQGVHEVATSSFELDNRSSEGTDMPKKGRAHREDAWTNAKKICRLNARQVEMARLLSMNPNKLPSLRPTSQQRWKLPVGAFIEECYRKRFGTRPTTVPNSLGRSPSQPNPHAPERLGDASWQLGDLVCYLINLADDLQKWLAHGMVDREILSAISGELREIAQALEQGAPISPVPEIPLPPLPTRRAVSRRGDPEADFDDEIPF